MLYVFIGCLTFGVLYSALSALLGGQGFDSGGMDGGAEVSGGTDSADIPSPFNPLVIASAIATFGGVGIIAKAGFKMGDMASSITALSFAGAVGAIIFFGVVRLMYNSQSDSTFSLNELIGEEANVITPIPRNGTGEITYVIKGVRGSLPARSAYKEDIPKGVVVKIKEINGNAAMVIQKKTIDDLEAEEMEK